MDDFLRRGHKCTRISPDGCLRCDNREPELGCDLSSGQIGKVIAQIDYKPSPFLKKLILAAEPTLAGSTEGFQCRLLRFANVEHFFQTRDLEYFHDLR